MAANRDTLANRFVLSLTLCCRDVVSLYLRELIFAPHDPDEFRLVRCDLVSKTYVSMASDEQAERRDCSSHTSATVFSVTVYTLAYTRSEAPSPQSRLYNSHAMNSCARATGTGRWERRPVMFFMDHDLIQTPCSSPPLLISRERQCWSTNNQTQQSELHRRSRCILPGLQKSSAILTLDFRGPSGQKTKHQEPTSEID